MALFKTRHFLCSVFGQNVQLVVDMTDISLVVSCYFLSSGFVDVEFFNMDVGTVETNKK